ncbi:hypothetical protein MRX96_006366 [Rhipicephalus microplus]
MEKDARRCHGPQRCLYCRRVRANFSVSARAVAPMRSTYEASKVSKFTESLAATLQEKVGPRCDSPEGHTVPVTAMQHATRESNARKQWIQTDQQRPQFRSCHGKRRKKLESTSPSRFAVKEPRYTNIQ